MLDYTLYELIHLVALDWKADFLAKEFWDLSMINGITFQFSSPKPTIRIRKLQVIQPANKRFWYSTTATTHIRSGETFPIQTKRSNDVMGSNKVVPSLLLLESVLLLSCYVCTQWYQNKPWVSYELWQRKWQKYNWNRGLAKWWGATNSAAANRKHEAGEKCLDSALNITVDTQTGCCICLR